MDNALEALERRYFSANQLELNKLKVQERKFDESKETPEDYLTDLIKLAILLFRVQLVQTDPVNEPDELETHSFLECIHRFA